MCMEQGYSNGYITDVDIQTRREIDEKETVKARERFREVLCMTDLLAGRLATC